MLRRAPEVLVLEDDHASFLCDVPCACVHEQDGRWAHLRSLSKSFNPDLRLSVMTGDNQTMNSVLDRLILIERWVSNKGVANSMCVKVQHQSWGALRNELQAQSGKKISAEHAAILIQLVAGLQN